MEPFDPPALRVLSLLQSHGAAFFCGGYVRDKYMHLPPNDIDIMTDVPLDVLLSLFPFAQVIEKDDRFQFLRFHQHGWSFDLFSYAGRTLAEMLAEKDFTVNALCHDGTRLYDFHGGIADLNRGILRPLDAPARHFLRSPQAYLRAIRLSAHLSFPVSADLQSFLLSHPSFFHANNPSRIQQEAYKILLAPTPLFAFSLLHDIGLLSCPHSFSVDVRLPPAIAKPHLALLLLTPHIGLETAIAFTELFGLSKDLAAKVTRLHPFLHDMALPDHPALLNEVLFLKRALHGADSPFFRSLLGQLRKKQKE